MKKLFVSNKDESARMFKYDWMELFSKVHFSVPLFLYVPVVGIFLYLAFTNPEMGVLAVVGLFAAGAFSWTVAEYFLHRFVFHYEPTTDWGQRVHFLVHGVHHDYPNDSKRLVMPPPISVPLAFLFYFLFKYLMGPSLMEPFYAGFVAGYLCYDMLHYAVHHANWDIKWFMQLKAHHLKHHFKEPEKGFGVSTPLWDLIIGTDYKSDEKKSVAS
ncbi:MAG: sterol desaturase family protein [Lewinellaceae bacterium]|nr:sterol desaturase family protein [Lewinellaceae bacterium]